jgi:hypothetical protein
MNTHDFLNQSAEQSINESVVNSLEQHYGKIFEEHLRKVLSINPNGGFIESDDILRLLSHREILNANTELGVDFVRLSLVPVLDTGDNDYIAYDTEGNTWCKFNIVDSIKYLQHHTLAKLLKR